MTREERHIAVLNRMLESMDVYDSIKPTEERKRAIKAAIKSLKKESLTDREQRIFLSAMQKEKDVCKRLDEMGDSGINLVAVCKSIERKVKNNLWE